MEVLREWSKFEKPEHYCQGLLVWSRLELEANMVAGKNVKKFLGKLKYIVEKCDMQYKVLAYELLKNSVDTSVKVNLNSVIGNSVFSFLLVSWKLVCEEVSEISRKERHRTGEKHASTKERSDVERCS